MARLLVYSRTTGYRHDSIPAGIDALRLLGAQAGHSVDATEDPAAFTPDGLAGYAVLVFLSTSGDVLDDAGRDALQRYMAAGGAWLGIHGAATTEYAWPYFGGLVGARFDKHPAEQTATMTVEDPCHPATSHLPAAWTWHDEWYDFQASPRSRVRVLLTVDEATYDGGTMGADHPVAWCHAYGGGRCLYTALGHAARTYAEPAFLRHLAGAVQWLTGHLRLPGGHFLVRFTLVCVTAWCAKRGRGVPVNRIRTPNLPIPCLHPGLTASALRANICTEATLRRVGNAVGKRPELV